MRRRSEESQRTDLGMPAPSPKLSKQVSKQSCEVGTVDLHTADSEPREGAPTTGVRKDNRASGFRAVPRLTATKTAHIFERRRFLPALGGVSAPKNL